MTNAQQALSDALQACAVARTKLAELDAKANQLANAEGDHVALIAAARDAYRGAAGELAAGGTDARAVDVAKVALREAQALADEAALAREGLAFIVSNARREFEQANRAVNVSASAVAQEQAHAIEERALTIAKELGEILIRHRSLAVLASQCESMSGNIGADPIGSSSGERSVFRDAVAEALRGPERVSFVVTDLLPATTAKRKAAA